MVWQGYAFCPPYRNGRRKEENFSAAHHIAFDFDKDGADLDFLMRPDSFGWTFASFAYSTPSSTKDHPKSRVVFVLAEPITDPIYFRKLYQAIAAEFEREGSRTDPACRDPLRLYYGSPNCRVVTNWSILTPDTVRFLIDRYLDENPEPKRPEPDQTTINHAPPDDYVERRIEGLLDKIIIAPDGEKHTTLNKISFTIGGYVPQYIGQGEAVERCYSAIVSNGGAADLRAARKTIEEAVSQGMGQPFDISVQYKRDMDELL
jgi:hypothetical protein